MRGTGKSNISWWIVLIFRQTLFLLVFIFFQGSASELSLRLENTPVFRIPTTKKGLDPSHVIQSFTHTPYGWLFLQSVGDRKLIFTQMDDTGKQLFFKEKVDYPGHGQGLSLLCKNRICDDAYLLTTAYEKSGYAVFEISESGEIHFLYDKYLGCKTREITVGEDDGHYRYLIAVIGKDVVGYDLEEILYTRPASAQFRFPLDPRQSGKRQWAQGLVYREGLIYVLTGDNKIDGRKYLSVYRPTGKAVANIELSTGREMAGHYGDKWELEGLYFDGNVLYTTVMYGSVGKNIMYLYRLLRVEK